MTVLWLLYLHWILAFVKTCRSCHVSSLIWSNGTLGFFEHVLFATTRRRWWWLVAIRHQFPIQKQPVISSPTGNIHLGQYSHFISFIQLYHLYAPFVFSSPSYFLFQYTPIQDTSQLIYSLVIASLINSSKTDFLLLHSENDFLMYTLPAVWDSSFSHVSP